MFTLISTALGFFTSFLPSVMQYFTAKQDHKNELEKMKAQAEIAKAAHGQKLEMVNVDAEIREIESLHKHDAAQKKDGWIGSYQASVRPTITYLFMALFLAVEVTALVQLVKMGTEMSDALDTLWSQEIMGLFSAIIAFWFGKRTFSSK
jgi:hypothetical protein